MTRKRVYRMSGPAVVIGFILLIPSILGILFGGLTFIVSIVGGSQKPNLDVVRNAIRTELKSEHVPAAIIDDIAADKHIDEDRLTPLTSSQQLAVRSAELKLTSPNAVPAAAACCGGGFSVIIVIGSFVGGLLGWLLVMRKTVLQCFRCGAVVAAS
jgi:hypothetical protein